MRAIAATRRVLGAGRGAALALRTRHLQLRTTHHRPVHSLRAKLRDPFAAYAAAPPTPAEAVSSILYDAPAAATAAHPAPPRTRHLLNCLVLNEPGVLSRISNIIAGRGFNIDSLVVASTDVPDLSRMTIVLNGPASTVEQARRQLEDLVPVWAVLDFTHTRVVERELLLVKVSTVPREAMAELAAASGRSAEDQNKREQTTSSLSPLLASSIQRQALIELAALFKGTVVDTTADAVIIEVCAKSDKVDAFLKVVKPFGIIEAARSGAMAMSRGLMADAAAVTDITADAERNQVDATLLPPG